MGVKATAISEVEVIIEHVPESVYLIIDGHILRRFLERNLMRMVHHRHLRGAWLMPVEDEKVRCTLDR